MGPTVMHKSGQYSVPAEVESLPAEVHDAIPPPNMSIGRRQFSNCIFLQLNSPQFYAWQGGALLASNPEDHNQYLVTRREYEENGHSFCEAKFPVT
nr:Actin protein 6 [Hymenolepis microstoma]